MHYRLFEMFAIGCKVFEIPGERAAEKLATPPPQYRPMKTRLSLSLALALSTSAFVSASAHAQSLGDKQAASEIASHSNVLEKLLPGFAGLYLDAQGRQQIALVPALTDDAEWSAAQALLARNAQRVDAKFSLANLRAVVRDIQVLAERSATVIDAQIELPSNRVIVQSDAEQIPALKLMLTSAGLNMAAIEFVAAQAAGAKASTYGICANPQGSGPQRVWRDQVTAAYLRDDLNQVWWLMKGAATAGGILGRPVGAVMLGNFLDSKGNVKLDYVGPLSDLPTAFGRQSAWISNASAVKAKISPMDNSAIAEARRRVSAGTLSGVLSYSTSVETVDSVDPDLYFAMGKFALKGIYKFARVNQVFGSPFIRVERVYEATDLYNWDPPRSCGIIDHIIPFSLVRAGKAKNFDVLVRWGQPEYRITP